MYVPLSGFLCFRMVYCCLGIDLFGHRMKGELLSSFSWYTQNINIKFLFFLPKSGQQLWQKHEIVKNKAKFNEKATKSRHHCIKYFMIVFCVTAKRLKAKKKTKTTSGVLIILRNFFTLFY